MELISTSKHHRNDYHWRGRCRHCGHEQEYGDGYADAYYTQKVVPGRHCSECGLNCHGEQRPDAEQANG